MDSRKLTPGTVYAHGRASVLSGWSACLDRKRHSDEESRGEISIRALKIWKEIRLFYQILAFRVSWSVAEDIPSAEKWWVCRL